MKEKEKIVHINLPKESVGTSVEKNSTNHLEPVIPIMKKIPETNSKFTLTPAFVVIILFGIGTGYLLAKFSPRTTSNVEISNNKTNSGVVNSEMEAGVNDEKSFPDTASGVLVEGGVGNEGTHRLDRSATKEKEVALSSTTINLTKYVGKKVQVNGQTISSKSGWLMDVGKIKVVK